MIKQKWKKAEILFALLCCLVFGVVAIYFNTFGIDTTAIMRFFNITESKQGMILTIQSFGGIAVTILLALYGEKLNKIYGVAAVLGIMLLSALLMGTIPLYVAQGNGYVLMLVFALIGGVGMNGLDVLLKGMVSDVFPDKRVTIFPILEVAYGLCALILASVAPVLVNPEIPETYTVPFLVTTAIGLVVLVAYLVCARQILPDSPYVDMTEIRKRTTENPAEIFKEKQAWILLLGSFLLVAFHDSLSMWLVEYCQQVQMIEYAAATRMLSLYLFGNIISRMAWTFLFRYISVLKAFVSCASVVTVLFLIFFLAEIPLTARYILIGVTGLVEGGLSTCGVLLCCEAFPERSASASSIFVMGVSIANLVMPLVVGKMAENLGFTAPMILLIVCLMLSAVTFSLAEKSRPDTGTEA